MLRLLPALVGLLLTAVPVHAQKKAPEALTLDELQKHVRAFLQDEGKERATAMGEVVELDADTLDYRPQPSGYRVSWRVWQRFNVLGALNAQTRELIAVTNTTVVNTPTLGELLDKIASPGIKGPVTLVLDNAKYQHHQAVKDKAKTLGIELLFLPGDSPNLNRIERRWRFIKKKALYGRYHANFADFKGVVEQVIAQLPSKHKDGLASLLTHNFQVFDNVSLLAA